MNWFDLIWNSLQGIAAAFGWECLLLLFVVAFFLREVRRQWERRAAQYEAEVRRMAQEKSALWERLMAMVGEERRSSMQRQPDGEGQT